MRVKTFVLGLAALLLWGLPIYAQGNPNGKLSGRVTSGNQPLSGVLVTVKSPNLQGTRTTRTSPTGDYLFPSLPPGDYTVSFELEGLQTVQQQTRLSAAQSSTLDTEMAATAVTEEIVVTGSLEDISRSVQSATTYTKTLVDELPTGRTINQIVALSPGVQPNGPSKSNDTGLGNITISGAPTYENLFMINGVVLNENIRGQAFDLFIEDAIQETTTATAGVSAEYGRFSGGVVNVITKSGGNDFSGSLRTTFNNQKWEEKRPQVGTAPVVQTDKIVPTYEATLGGPIMKDRLWFFAAGRSQDKTQSLSFTAPTSAYPGGSYTNDRDQQRYEGKLTATITPRHTLLGSYSKIDDKEVGNSFGSILDAESLVTRETPQKLWSVNYTGTFTDNLLLTAQYSERKFSFIGSGAPTTDLIEGTLLLDRAHGNARYHSPTFCGVCRPEDRNNKNGLAKLSYFLSSPSLGSHDLVAGYDSYDDIRAADNHQSGSDYRVFGTTTLVRNGVIYPVFNGDGSTIIQFNPIAKTTQGTSFKTNSLFANDTWRYNDRLTINMGLRYDKNDGTNEEGKKVANDSKFSPRLAATFDPRGDGNWIFHASYGVYVAALANSIGDSSSAGGVPATFQWAYLGPAINTDPNAPLLGQDDALRILFNWFNSNGGTGRTPIGVSIPGINTQIRGSLSSPSVTEYTVGATARLGSRGLIRADYIHRDWHDFYSARTDLSTGRATGSFNGSSVTSDLTLVVNNDSLYDRKYDGLHTQWRFRANDRLDVGGTWTFSHTKGNFEGENQGSGPILGGLQNFPEYLRASWNAPEGDLNVDQRHRVTAYGVYKILTSARHELSASLVQSYFSGHPYSAAATVNVRDYITNPGYVTPPVRNTYFFSERGAFTTPAVYPTDFRLNYSFRVGGLDLFLQPEVQNVFNQQHVDTTDIRYLDTSVATRDNGGDCDLATPGTQPCAAFNPFTEKPVEGVHFQRGPNFGKASNILGYQQPRTYRFTMGLRF